MVGELTHDARAPEFCTQGDSQFRFDWGFDGMCALAPTARVLVIVDVLRFTTAVCAALEAGVVVLPYRWADESAAEFAAANDAVLAGRREHGEPSLSPTDLLQLQAGTRLVLPSPNGATLAFAAHEHGAGHVLAGCLRNASAVADTARRMAGPDGTIAVIAAGERWHSANGALRPAVEDLVGAGAVLAALDPSASRSAPRCSAEASAARAAFTAARPRLVDHLHDCASGRELIARGWEDDVAIASALDVTGVVPLLDPQRREFVPATPTRRDEVRSE